MARLQKTPLRPLKEEEREYLSHLSRAQSAKASEVARAKMLLSVADGATYAEAARRVGRKVGDTVSELISRFNQEGLKALNLRHGGGPEVVYGPKEKEKILECFRRTPDRAKDGTGTWSLTTLQRALRRAPDGLPTVSTYTIFLTLKEAGYTWQEGRSWCKTGAVIRYRKAGPVEVIDPDTEAKKN